jgi:hypothetical protein
MTRSVAEVPVAGAGATGTTPGAAGAPVDLRRALAGGLPAPGRAGAPLVFGPSLFGGLGGGALVAPASAATGRNGHRASALHAVVALETLHLLAAEAVAATATRAERVRQACGLAGDGPFLVLPDGAGPAARRAGLAFGADGRGLLATVADDTDVEEIVERLGEALRRDA